jgi:hypothetical protein
MLEAVDRRKGWAASKGGPFKRDLSNDLTAFVITIEPAAGTQDAKKNTLLGWPISPAALPWMPPCPSQCRALVSALLSALGAGFLASTSSHVEVSPFAQRQRGTKGVAPTQGMVGALQRLCGRDQMGSVLYWYALVASSSARRM